MPIFNPPTSAEEAKKNLNGFFVKRQNDKPDSVIGDDEDVKKRYNFTGGGWVALRNEINELSWMVAIEKKLSPDDMGTFTKLKPLADRIWTKPKTKAKEKKGSGQ